MTSTPLLLYIIGSLYAHTFNTNYSYASNVKRKKRNEDTPILFLDGSHCHHIFPLLNIGLSQNFRFFSSGLNLNLQFAGMKYIYQSFFSLLLTLYLYWIWVFDRDEKRWRNLSNQIREEWISLTKKVLTNRYIYI